MNYKDKFVGIKVYGFCDGFFGSGSYSDKIIIASGEDWIVAKNEKGEVEFASFNIHHNMEELIQEWSLNN